MSFAKKNFIVSKRKFARVVKTLFERAFSMSNIKIGFTKYGIHPFDPNAIDKSKIMSCSSLSTDESSFSMGAASSSATAYPGSSSLDTSCAPPSVTSSDESQTPSVNSSPIVSSFFSHANDGYSSPQLPSESLTSTPLASAWSMGQPVTPQSSQSQQKTTPRSRPRVENPLVRIGLVPQHLADIFLLLMRTTQLRNVLLAALLVSRFSLPMSMLR